MALPVHSSSTFFSHKPLISYPPRSTSTSFIKCQQKPSSESDPDESSTSASSAASSSAGVGFGKGRRAAVIRRRPPVQQPNLVSKPVSINSGGEERGRNETAFILAWLCLGGVILAQGLSLAASGFLPEEWDTFIVKYVYPVFTPTVGLFVAGSVAYGVLKYFQNEQFNKK